VSEHLSAGQLEGWLIGERTREVEDHLRTCQSCAAELGQSAAQLTWFAGAVRNWSETLQPPARFSIANASRTVKPRWSLLFSWRAGLGVAALLTVIAVPVYHREQTRRQQTAIAAAQDEVLLRQVESRISQTVPAPMEPLAKLMMNQSNR
jgi:hypothetical protein